MLALNAEPGRVGAKVGCAGGASLLKEKEVEGGAGAGRGEDQLGLGSEPARGWGSGLLIYCALANLRLKACSVDLIKGNQDTRPLGSLNGEQDSRSTSCISSFLPFGFSLFSD